MQRGNKQGCFMLPSRHTCLSPVPPHPPTCRGKPPEARPCMTARGLQPPKNDGQAEIHKTCSSKYRQRDRRRNGAKINETAIIKETAVQSALQMNKVAMTTIKALSRSARQPTKDRHNFLKDRYNLQ
eukprot:1156411-Pelagomonas_calceolata.AAC.7